MKASTIIIGPSPEFKEILIGMFSKESPYWDELIKNSRK
jgi:hypothetical protein